MKPEDIAFVAEVVRKRSGLILGADKGYLVESRLGPIARQRELASVDALIQTLRTSKDEKLLWAVTDALTTNETFFFRDRAPFDLFRDTLLPKMITARASSRRLRIWCAAASSGQEPYSIAMLLDEAKARLAGWSVEIVATDISTEILDRAKAGLYSQFEVQRGLPINLLLKHFTQEGEQWRISPAIRSMVSFRPLNLIRDFGSLGTFDLVYCRNVLIYFDQPTKTDVLRRLSNALAPDGFMVLGAAETVIGLTDALSPHPDHRGLYVPGRIATAASPMRLVASR